MQNTAEQSIPRLLNQTQDLKQGMVLHEVTLQMKRHSATAVSADYEALEASRRAYEQGRTDLSIVVTSLRDAFSAGRVFLTAFRDVLKPVYGNGYSEVWDPTGFIGSLVIPAKQDDIFAQVRTAHHFLVDHVDRENPGLHVTVMDAQALHDSIINGRTEVNEQRAQLAILLATRDAAAAKLRKRVRGVINELDEVLEPLDPRWLSFGLNMPGANEVPDVPENLKAVLIGPTAASIKWTASPRTEYYRVWKKVIGTDQELVPVGSPSDLDFTFEALPSNATIELAVSAVNNGGESQPSEVVTVKTA